MESIHQPDVFRSNYIIATPGTAQLKRCIQRPIYNHLANTCLGDIDSQRAHFKKKSHMFLYLLPQCEQCLVTNKLGIRRK